MLTEEMQKILRCLQINWVEADESESDIEEHRAFRPAILMLEGLLTRKDSNYNDLLFLIPFVPPYPNWGKHTVRDLAEALRDKKNICFFERNDGAIRWEIEKD